MKCGQTLAHKIPHAKQASCPAPCQVMASPSLEKNNSLIFSGQLDDGIPQAIDQREFFLALSFQPKIQGKAFLSPGCLANFANSTATAKGDCAIVIAGRNGSECSAPFCRQKYRITLLNSIQLKFDIRSTLASNLTKIQVRMSSDLKQLKQSSIYSSASMELVMPKEKKEKERKKWIS